MEAVKKNKSKRKHSHDEDGIRCGLHTYIAETLDAEKLKNLTNIDFLVIYAFYQQKGVLNNAQKCKLSKIIMQHLLENNLNLIMNRYDLLYLSKVVCDVFTSEIPEEYFTSSANCQRPTGKLYDAYSNYRRLFSSAGIINRTRKSKYSNSMPEPLEVKPEPDIYDDLNFVKTYTGSLKIFMEKWKSCFTLRRNMLEDQKLTPSVYLAKFKLFQTDNTSVFKLFFEDCKMLYPQMSDNITWDIHERILDKAKEMKLRMPNVVSWLSKYEEYSSRTKVIVSLLLLPYLFPSTKIKSTQGKESFKPTKNQMQEKFIRYFETLEEADDYEESHNYEQIPQTVFVGPFDNIFAYVTICNKKYHFASPLEAMEECFHLYHALNIRYPPESSIIWSFIQINIFNIKTKFDNNSSSIKSMWHSLTSIPLEKRVKHECDI